MRTVAHMILRLSACFVISSACAARLLAQAAGGSGPAVEGERVEVFERRLGEPAAASTQVVLEPSLGDSAAPAEIAGRLANFSVASSGARSFTDTFALRGLVNTPLFGDPAVTLYLDDLPLGSNFTFPTSLPGIEAAELLRGAAQNTRFGRAGEGGVLRLTTDSANSGGKVHVFLGNHEARGAGAQVSASQDSVGVFVAAGYSARDGFIENTRLHQTVDDHEASSGLAHLRFAAGGGAWSLLVFGERVRDGAQALVPLNGPKFSVSRAREGETSLDDFGAALRGEFKTVHGQASSTTSYTDWKLGPATNSLSFGFAELQNASELRQRNLSEELAFRFLPTDSGHGSVGVFASTGRTDGEFTRAFSGAVFEQSSYRLDHRTASVFGEWTWKANDAFSLTAGLRLQADEKKLDRREKIPSAARYQRTRDTAAALPKVVAAYRLDEQTEASAGVVTGYKPGGFSPFTGNRALSAFGSERLIGLEGEISRRSRDQHWAASARVFAYRVRGYQIERSFQTGAQADDYLVVNAERARSIGGELELSWKPISALAISGSFGLTDVTLQNFRDPYTGVSYAGNRAPYAPRYDGNLRVEWHPTHGFFARAEVTASGRVFYTESEAPKFSQGAYALIHASLGYQARNYTVALVGNNLTDREYFSAITPGVNHGTPGEPRTVGITATLRF